MCRDQINDRPDYTTPGFLLFVIIAVTNISLREISREIWLFLAVLIAALLLLILVPEITLRLSRCTKENRVYY